MLHYSILSGVLFYSSFPIPFYHHFSAAPSFLFCFSLPSLPPSLSPSPSKVDRGVWRQVAHLYPALVQCVTCNSSEVRTTLKEVLDQFSDFITMTMANQ